MTVFVDTSALYAVVNRADKNHRAASGFFVGLRPASTVTHSYVILETCALLQRRHGLGPVRAFHERFVPLLHVVWIDETFHRLVMASHLAADQRRVSLVDRTSFEIMRTRGLTEAFAFDDDFAAEGFTLVP